MATSTRSPLPPAAPAIDRDLYPFTGHFFDAGGGARMHYLDEGSGPPLVMVHGNPTWSFYYRDLVRRLSGRYRCVVPDHVGCGLSDKPADAQYRYTLEQRARDIEALLEHLGITSNLTLVLHDWGGIIGMACAHWHPDCVRRLVLFSKAIGRFPDWVRTT